ncbi:MULTISPECIES: DUF881 domain-containing protein [unclassified Mycolicibacterium]|uniref:DUF881 domain-containing protein n=1 Tax=unclassified Mycolicibacterium TaxID=2636767 RepID=UPI0012DDDBFB|nr:MULTISPECIES: DUF881 domain-containing protein [unclassified Mycolicibacterium]MUL85440.1 DUF881 domain-containing protein [Mycolicibacterium sp. CBMA 329]MUL88796.1 DUF881 domain-containing protein [Mycolicibacterium sp. CBMA 331]MUM03064.1 DUF881 domain-containing protein [Mycolicibacterium sp. CBMA 334]MUM24886.1 DUF881 domain-containing protein [Mycolicibacterium sp. CBMA 295]MUM40443.1 DUF881 domain-containing protein [Mycolicibacterium sp. CBMA 247]
MSTLGGYESGAGLNDHEAHAPSRIPLPSLLRSLLSEHLDPGYAAAAVAREAGDRPRRRVADFGWLVVGVGAIATVFAVAAGQAQTAAPAAREAQHTLAGRVRAVQVGADMASSERNTLVDQVDSERRSRLGMDENGQQLLGSLDTANIAAAAIPMIGPGLTVTVTDPGLSKDLSDVSKQRVAGGQQVILDRDLQLVVNSLWASGAEAISVGGVRVGAGVTIRQAGGGILVDNQPINSPYAVVAIGPPKGMADAFDRTPGLQRLRLLETSYGVGVHVSAGDGLTVPAVSVRDVNFAKQIG